MTGIAAVAMCAAFTSCSHDMDFEATTAEELEMTKYESVFERRFGQPAEDQDWGYSKFAYKVTRADQVDRNNSGNYIDVNGNLWESCPSLGATEEEDVVRYVSQLTTYPKNAPTGLENYFVTQVHCGTETYTNGDGSAGILGSAHMNHLQIAMQSGGVVNSDGSLSRETMLVSAPSVLIKFLSILCIEITAHFL